MAPIGRKNHHREAGTAPATFPSVPMYTVDPPPSPVELTVATAFVEVWLAKQGHHGPAGVKLLEKIQRPILPTLYGALLDGVDYVFVGAGSRTDRVRTRSRPQAASPLPTWPQAGPAFAERPRRCDLGYLRQPYRRPDGTSATDAPQNPSTTSPTSAAT